MSDVKRKLIAGALLGTGTILGYEVVKGLGGFALRKSPELYIGRQTKKTRTATEALGNKTDETNRLLMQLINKGKNNSSKRKDTIRYTRKIEPLA